MVVWASSATGKDHLSRGSQSAYRHNLPRDSVRLLSIYIKIVRAREGWGFFARGDFTIHGLTSPGSLGSLGLRMVADAVVMRSSSNVRKYTGTYAVTSCQKYKSAQTGQGVLNVRCSGKTILQGLRLQTECVGWYRLSAEEYMYFQLFSIMDWRGRP